MACSGVRLHAASTHLDEGTHLDAVGQHGALTDMGEGTEAAVIANSRGSGDHCERPDDGVAADLGTTVDIGVARVDNGDAFGHEAALNALLHKGVGLGEVVAGVDAKDIAGAEYVECDDLSAHGFEQGGGVGEVVFALGVAGIETVESFPKSREIEDIAARVNLKDGGFGGSAIALFDNSKEASRGVAKDTTKAGGVVDECGAEKACSLFLIVTRQEVGKWLGPKQWLVADENESRAFVIVKERAACFYGVAGTELPELLGEVDIGLATKQGSDLIAAVPDDHDY